MSGSSAINRAARIGPIEGIWQSSLVALCFYSRLTERAYFVAQRPQGIELLVVKLGPTRSTPTSVILASHSAR